MAKSKVKGSKAGKGKASIVAGKDMAALVKAAQNAPTSGGSMKFANEGDTIAGKILSMKEEESKFPGRGPQVVLVIDTPDGPRTTYCNASAEQGLKNGGAKVGSKVAIVFKGTMNTGKGRPFKLFSVAVGK
jgi:hypothetical protein